MQPCQFPRRPVGTPARAEPSAPGRAGGSRKRFLSFETSNQMESDEENIDRLDPRERHEDAADAVEHQVSSENPPRAEGPVRNAPESQWDQGDDDERVEDDRGEDGTLGRGETHDCLLYTYDAADE